MEGEWADSLERPFGIADSKTESKDRLEPGVEKLKLESKGPDSRTSREEAERRGGWMKSKETKLRSRCHLSLPEASNPGFLQNPSHFNVKSLCLPADKSL